MDVEIDNLMHLATRFRKAVVAVVEENANARLSGFPIDVFPRGACGEASRLLATYLREHGRGEFEYCFGLRPGKSHAWLRRDELIVDITADQFEDQDCPVIVTRNQAWHSTFHDVREGTAYYDNYPDDARNWMLRFYQYITQKIPSTVP